MDFKLPNGNVLKFADNKQFGEWLVAVNIGQKELWVNQGRENEKLQKRVEQLEVTCGVYEQVFKLIAERLEDLALNASEGVKRD
jgi:hypothetical protein